jgi:hypothetical protein
MDVINTYEDLRSQILKDTVSQQASVILYHGVLHGLQILTKFVDHHYSDEMQESNLRPVMSDNGLIRILTNMILYKKMEVMHVY